MSVCTLFKGSEYLALDVTTSLGMQRDAEVPTTTVFEGKTGLTQVSDNYRPNTPTITIQGVVSATKTRTNEEGVRSPQEFRAMMDSWIDDGHFIAFYGTNDGAIPNLKNVVIKDYDVVRDVTRSDGLAVSITLKQVATSNAVKATVNTVPKEETKSITAKPSENTPQGKTTDNTNTMANVAKRNNAALQTRDIF